MEFLGGGGKLILHGVSGGKGGVCGGEVISGHCNRRECGVLMTMHKL